MEVTSPRPPWRERLFRFFLKEPRLFQDRAEINWRRVSRAAGLVIAGAILGLLLMPSAPPEEAVFHEKADPGTTSARTSSEENDPTKETLAQLQAARVNAAAVPSSLDHLYATSGGGGTRNGGQSDGDRSASMILVRGGQDSRNQLPPGARIPVRIAESVIVSDQAMPITGFVLNEVVYESDIAIPEGAKMLGEVSFDASTDRAQVSWRSVILPDGRERPLQAVGTGRDGHLGVAGEVHSQALKNTIGQTLTRFIGAYAEGSMSHGQFGAAEGGHENGIKNAIAATAQDRAEAWAEDLKEERRWIELKAGSESVAVLSQPFVFRDPGVIYGR